jgi:hypothetical protein
MEALLCFCGASWPKSPSDHDIYAHTLPCVMCKVLPNRLYNGKPRSCPFHDAIHTRSCHNLRFQIFVLLRATLWEVFWRWKKLWYCLKSDGFVVYSRRLGDWVWIHRCTWLRCAQPICHQAWLEGLPRALWDWVFCVFVLQKWINFFFNGTNLIFFSIQTALLRVFSKGTPKIIIMIKRNLKICLGDELCCATWKFVNKEKPTQFLL